MSDPFIQAAPVPARKPPPWLWWLLGGLGALAVLCVVGAVAVAFVLYQIGSHAALTAPTSTTGHGIYNPKADAHREIATALATAKATGKLVLLDFGADWCPDCVVLARHLDSTAVKPYLDGHFVVVRVNVGKWDANLDIDKQYGSPIKNGIPAVVVIDSANTVVASTGGGELANARTSTREDILALLKQWVAAR